MRFPVFANHLGGVDGLFTIVEFGSDFVEDPLCLFPSTLLVSLDIGLSEPSEVTRATLARALHTQIDFPQKLVWDGYENLCHRSSISGMSNDRNGHVRNPGSQKRTRV